MHRIWRWRSRPFLLGTIGAVLLLSLPATAAHQGTSERAEAGLVSEDPADHTPHVLDGDVRAIAVVGDTVVVGGHFSAVLDSAGKRVHDRLYLFAFELRSGRILPFAPWVDGPVLALAPGPDGTVFAGGEFTRAGTQDAIGIARFDLATGEPVPAFRASLDQGHVHSLVHAHGWLYIGGSFSHLNGVRRKALARVDPVTGLVDKFDPRLAGPELGRVKVEDIAVSPAGDRLLVAGALTRAAGEFRVQLAMYDLTRPKPVLADWWTEVYNERCRAGFDTYLRGVDFSPDGRFFVVVTTGRHTHPKLLCDTAARFETYVTGEVNPTWVNHTGGDSLYSVEVTRDAVYVGGHQRWMDNPHGDESPGPGSVPRKGIAALHPELGLALDWNPTRTRGAGVHAFADTPQGLLVGSDTDEIGHEYHGKIALLPY